MSQHQQISWALKEAEERILVAVQNGGETWTPVVDDDGNEDVPDTEREVMVFLCGDRGIRDERPGDASYGLSMGWFDVDKRYWRVRGKIERYVTHWRECPPPPNGPL